MPHQAIHQASSSRWLRGRSDLKFRCSSCIAFWSFQAIHLVNPPSRACAQVWIHMGSTYFASTSFNSHKYIPSDSVRGLINLRVDFLTGLRPQEQRDLTLLAPSPPSPPFHLSRPDRPPPPSPNTPLRHQHSHYDSACTGSSRANNRSGGYDQGYGGHVPPTASYMALPQQQPPT